MEKRSKNCQSCGRIMSKTPVRSIGLVHLQRSERMGIVKPENSAEKG